MDYKPETRLSVLSGVSKQYIEALTENGINTVGDLDKVEVEELAAITYDVTDKPGKGRNEPHKIGVEAAKMLKDKFALPKQISVTKSDQKRYVYYAKSARTITLAKTQMAYTPDGAGGVNHVQVAAGIKGVFNGSPGAKGAILVLTEPLAKEWSMSFGEAKKLIEAHPQFDKEFRLVEAPLEDQVITDATKSPLLTKGVRSSGAV